jgi:CHAT domain-containing protein
VERAAASLKQAFHLSPHTRGVLNDLAVAYLAVGERTQQLTPMLHALDAIERAVLADSLDRSILFNRALILQRLYLLSSAERAWARYLAVERDPDWRAEAEAHSRALRQVADTVSWGPFLHVPPAPITEADRARITRQVRRSPQLAREFAFSVLGRWGAAYVHNEPARASQFLALAREIGDVAPACDLDRSIFAAVSEITRASHDSDRLQKLAAAHVEFARGFDLFFRVDYEGAAASLTRAATALRIAGSPLDGWATFYRAAAEMNLGHFGRAEALFREAIAEATPAEPALLGKAVWAIGVSQLRQGNYERAITSYRDAVPYLVRAREPENQATISYLLSEALLLAGQTVPARLEELRGLRLLSAFRRSGFLNNHLTIVALDARGAELGYAALAVVNEVLGIAHSVGRADVIAWAYQARAREYDALGLSQAAHADLNVAMRWVDRIDAGRGQDRIRADVMLIRGQMLRKEDPRAAFDTLSDVVDVYRDVGIGMNLPAALFETALAAEAAGHPNTSRRHLEDAIRHIERQQSSYHTVELRATRAETVEHVFDTMIRLELARGRFASALGYLERSRMAAWPRASRPATLGGFPDTGNPTARIADRIPSGMLFLDYALLSDRLVIWTASNSGWRHHSIPVRRDSIAALVARFHQEASMPEATATSARAKLFDLLIRPVAIELQGVTQLTVVPDRELFRLPFAALWDRETGAYVVERYQVRTIPNAAFLISTAGDPARPAASALVVGNPTLGKGLRSALPNLPGAAREAEQVAQLYGSRHTLLGAAASRDALLERLPNFAVFHFAGHAVFNSEQPELSYLALSQGEDGAILQAREIGELRLSNLDVVVLSACSTLNARSSRAGGNAGLAYSFLRAGAPATISTVWDVSDEPTSDVLVEFHRKLTGGVPAAEALRLAQVAILHASPSRPRAPIDWAAFVYTGS